MGYDLQPVDTPRRLVRDEYVKKSEDASACSAAISSVRDRIPPTKVLDRPSEHSPIAAPQNRLTAERRNLTVHSVQGKTTNPLFSHRTEQMSANARDGLGQHSSTNVLLPHMVGSTQEEKDDNDDGGLPQRSIKRQKREPPKCRKCGSQNHVPSDRDKAGRYKCFAMREQKRREAKEIEDLSRESHRELAALNQRNQNAGTNDNTEHVKAMREAHAQQPFQSRRTAQDPRAPRTVDEVEKANRNHAGLNPNGAQSNQIRHGAYMPRLGTFSEQDNVATPADWQRKHDACFPPAGALDNSPDAEWRERALPLDFSSSSAQYGQTALLNSLESGLKLPPREPEWPDNMDSSELSDGNETGVNETDSDKTDEDKTGTDDSDAEKTDVEETPRFLWPVPRAQAHFNPFMDLNEPFRPSSHSMTEEFMDAEDIAPSAGRVKMFPPTPSMDEMLRAAGRNNADDG